MVVMRKVPVSDVQKDNILQKVEEILERNTESAYTVQGIMIDQFAISERDIDGKSFNQRKKELNTLYSRIRRSLKKLIEEGSIEHAKHGKADVYWWKMKGLGKRVRQPYPRRHQY